MTQQQTTPLRRIIGPTILLGSGTLKATKLLTESVR